MNAPRHLGVYVVEHKTTAMDIGLGSPYWKRLTLDDQISTYLEGVGTLGYEPRGVLYDVIRKPGEKPYEVNTRRAVAETPEEYERRIIEKIAEDPNRYFQRGVVVRMGNEAYTAAKNTWHYAQQIQVFRKAKSWPQNPDACEKWGRFCDFWSVCAGEESIYNSLKFQPKARKNVELSDTKTRLPVLSTTALSCLRRCPRLYEYKYEMGLEPVERADVLRFGSLMHLGLEAWWLSNGSLEAALLAMSKRSENGQMISVDPFEAAKARALMLGYHAKWSEVPMNVLAVEKEFTAPLVNPDTGKASRTYLRGGKVDAIAEVDL